MTSKKDQSAAETLKDLESLLEELGVRLTHDRRVDGKGGYCVVHGEARMIVNSRLPLSEQVEMLLEELGRLDLSGVFIPPALRRKIDEASSAGEALGD